MHHVLGRLILLVALAWCVPGDALAACTGGGSSWSCDTKPEAYDQVLYTGSDFCPVFGYPSAVESATYSESGDTVNAAYKCDSITVAGATASWVMECAAPELEFNPSSYECDTPCSERAEETNWLYDEAHATACHEGCSYDGGINLDGSVSFIANGGTCTVGPGNPAPTLDTDGDGVADPDDAFPDDPDESSDSDGDGIGDNGDVAPDDPTNGGDDGTGNESDNEADGGGNCGAPPVCIGDGIACNTLFQTWSARCAVERTEGQLDGIKDAIDNLPSVGPNPEGLDTLDELLESGNELLGNMNGKVDDLLDMLRGVDSTGVPDMTGPNVPEEEADAELKTWSSGLGETAACPTLAAVDVEFMGNAVAVNLGIDSLCETLEFLRPLILAISALAAAWVVIGGIRS